MDKMTTRMKIFMACVAGLQLGLAPAAVAAGIQAAARTVVRGTGLRAFVLPTTGPSSVLPSLMPTNLSASPMLAPSGKGESLPYGDDSPWLIAPAVLAPAAVREEASALFAFPGAAKGDNPTSIELNRIQEAVVDMPNMSLTSPENAVGFSDNVSRMMTREAGVSAAALEEPNSYGQGSALQTKIEAMGGVIAQLRAEIGRVIVGQQEMVDSIIMAMIAREHILLEGVPGVAKTAAVRAFADALGADFQRIQGTPDKMPADILGAEILQTDPETGARALKLERGPIFARVVLVDEVNRMMPKTQAALLEAMQERRVTIGRETLDLPQPFLLLATQNPIEQDGTFPLPEAQMDRFMFKVIVPQPEREERKKIAELNRLGVKARANKVVGLDDLMQATALAEKVHMSEALRDYAQDILDAAADPAASGIGGQGMVEQAMITRAAIFLEKAARINALIKGRSWVLPEDVRDVAPKILRHRILMSYSAGDLTPDKLIQEILKRVPVPSGPYGQ